MSRELQWELKGFYDRRGETTLSSGLITNAFRYFGFERTKSVLNRILPQLAAEAKKLAPYKTGALKESITWFVAPDGMWGAYGSPLRYACWVGGSWILTEGGKKSIEDVTVGDRIFSDEGFRKVKRTFTYDHSGDIVSIKRIGWNTPIRVTVNHKLAVVSRKQCEHEHSYTYWCKENCKFHNSNRMINCERHYREYEIEWKKASDISIGDMLVGVKKYKTEPIVDDSLGLAWAIGFYLAEGNTDKDYYVTISTHEKEDLFRCAWKKAIIDNFRIGGKFTEYTKKGTFSHSTRFCSREAVDFFKQFGKNANGKFLPEWVFDLSDNEKAALITGYYDGDGTASKHENVVDSVSEGLAYGIYLLAQTMGIHTKMKRRDPMEPTYIESLGYIVKGNYPIYNVSMSRFDAKDIGLTIKGSLPSRKGPMTLDFDGFALYPITEISLEEYNGKVYDIEMEEDRDLLNNGHCYYCDGILSSNSYQEYGTVHNIATHYLEGALNILKMQNLGG